MQKQRDPMRAFVQAPLTREQVRRVDQLAMERYGISGLVLMENAGRNAAEIINRHYGTSGQAFIACGSGNNGGDGCVIARHLHNAGWSVRLTVFGDESRFTSDMRTNLQIVQAMKLDVVIAPDPGAQMARLSTIAPHDVVIDALLGTGFSGEVRSPLAEVIEAINAACKRACVAIDLPSGLDCDTGRPSTATIRADLTITFVAPKIGFSEASAAEYLGQVEVADIGAPRELVESIQSEAVQ